MNKVILSGRLIKDVDVRYTTGENSFAIAKFTMAVDRKFKKEGQPTADFIQCIGYKKTGEFCEKYLHKGMKVIVDGSIQTGSYTHKEGYKVYTTDIIVESIEFCDKKEDKASENTAEAGAGFMSIPDSADEGGLPFR